METQTKSLSLEISNLKSKLEATTNLIENIYSRLEHKGVSRYNDDYCTECDGVLNQIKDFRLFHSLEIEKLLK